VGRGGGGWPGGAQGWVRQPAWGACSVGTGHPRMACLCRQQASSCMQSKRQTKSTHQDGIGGVAGGSCTHDADGLGHNLEQAVSCIAWQSKAMQAGACRAKMSWQCSPDWGPRYRQAQAGASRHQTRAGGGGAAAAARRQHQHEQRWCMWTAWHSHTRKIIKLVNWGTKPTMK
jgi:hypothetical protein